MQGKNDIRGNIPIQDNLYSGKRTIQRVPDTFERDHKGVTGNFIHLTLMGYNLL